MKTEKIRLLAYLQQYWLRFTISIVSAALYGIVSAVPSYIIKHTVDDIFIKNYRHLIIPLLVIFVLFFILKGLFMYATTYYMQWVGNRIVTDIRHDLFNKIIYFPLSFYQQHSTGKLMSHFLNDVQLVQNGFERLVKNGVRSFFEAFFLIVWAFVLSWKLALLMLVIGPLVALTILIVGRAIKRASRTIQNEMATLTTVLQEIFVGIREIKSFNGENTEIRRFDIYLKRCFVAFKKNVIVEALLPASIEPIAMLGGATAFYVAIQQVLAGTMSPGSMASFFAAVLLSYQPLKRLMCMYSTMQGALSAAERLFEVMDTPYPEPVAAALQPIVFGDSIQLHDVTFSYDDGTRVFDHAYLTINKGDVVGVVGQSGSGKSTLCDMLLGFMNPTSGTITIDGQPYETLSMVDVRNLIGYVGQRTFLFNDSVENNVMYPHQKVAHLAVITACIAAHAHEFIIKLKDGYDSLVGENGNLLSGGQKQRLTIARALLKDPEILIFDEATSALDAESEKMIQQTIQELRGKKTIIVITHRPSLLECVDRVVHVQDGMIQEAGKIRNPGYLQQVQE